MAYNVQLKKSDGSLYEDVYVATKWSLISDKPSTFTPTSHNHNDIYYTETEINTKLNGKANTSHNHTKSQITDFPTSMPPTAHNHNDIYYTETEVNTKLSGKANTNHTHDDRYYTETEIDTKLSGKANTSHNHTKSQITDFPTSMPPTAHNHNDIYYTETEIDTKLGSKANTTHNHDNRYYTETEIDTALSSYVLKADNILLSKISTGSTYTDILIGAEDGSIGAIPQSTFLTSGGTAADSSKLGGQLPSYYLNHNNLTNKPTALKNPYSLTVKQDGVTLGTYNGSTAKEIDITTGTKQWTHLGTVPHVDGALSFPLVSGETFSEYMVIYTDHLYEKYSDVSEVLYGPVRLVSGMSLPGYAESGISCNSAGITIEWNPGGGAGAKSNIIVYGR